MDIRLIVREMAKKGLGEEEIKRNLVELGVGDPDKVYAEAMGAKPVEKPVQAARVEVSGVKDLFGEDEKEKEEEEEKPLFEETGRRAEKGGGKEEKEKRDIPELEITSVSSEGEEKVLDIEKMMFPGEKESREELVSRLGGKGTDRKLAEINASLKALEELMKRVLETNREILLRLKK
jgi:hypothetical protein